MALKMSTPLLFIRMFFIFLKLFHRLLALCRIGIHRGNGHRHWLHFVPAIGQGVKCECIDTGLLVLNVRVIFRSRNGHFSTAGTDNPSPSPLPASECRPTYSRQRGYLPTSGSPPASQSISHPPPEIAYQMMR